jgi:hypothetical protein
MIDPIQVIESSYAVSTGTEPEWLGQLAASVASNLPSFAGTAVAFTYDVRDDGWVAIRSFVASGQTGLIDGFTTLGAIDTDLQADVAKLYLESGIVAGASRLQRHIDRGALRPFYENVFVAHGFADMLMVRAIDPTRSGCAIAFPTKGALDRLASPVVGQWKRLTAHLAAGLRLRRALATGGDRTDAGGGVEPEAVLLPNGRLEHAVGPATSAAARENLSVAARAIDRARGPLRRRNPSEAIETWRGLVAGRWSLVDRFERDGRRYLVAHKNDPATRDPRGLTERERQVLGYADLGRSNKLIAYELGLSASTVGVILMNARAKLKRIVGA